MCAVSVARTPYEQHRGYVLSVLSRRCRWLDFSEREAIFHDAYALMLEKERAGELDLEAMHPHQVRSYLVQTSLYKALDEGKRAERRRAEPMGDDALTAPDGATPLEEALASSLDGARVREIVDELPERRRAIVKLRYFLDCAPGEVQALLGIRERVYRRELERAMHQIAERYELVRDGSYCESRRSLLTAYVAGLAGPNRAREARAHLDSCPGCRHWAVQLREATREVAALLPLPVLADRGDALGRVAHALAGVRDHVLDLGASVRHHATGVATRVDAGTAGMSSAARPGTVAAAVAGCLAIGGGATYCVVEGVPGALDRLVSVVRSDAEPAARTVRRSVAQPATTPATTASPAPAAKPRATAPAPQKTTTTAKPSAAEQEFGPSPGPAPSTGSSSPASPSQAPAPAAADEFGP